MTEDSPDVGSKTYKLRNAKANRYMSETEAVINLMPSNDPSDLLVSSGEFEDRTKYEAAAELLDKEPDPETLDEVYSRLEESGFEPLSKPDEDTIYWERN